MKQDNPHVYIVSTHSRPKAAGYARWGDVVGGAFQHTAARRRLGRLIWRATNWCAFQHTAARRRLGAPRSALFWQGGFNTQPPEGGWAARNGCRALATGFNTQPPEGGWSLSQKPCSIRFRSPDFAKLPRKA